MSRLNRRLQSGLTMIEVLITLLIVSFGLLGVGALQLMSLQVNQGANQRTQAAMLAVSVLDAIRGNRPNAVQYGRNYGAGAGSPTSTNVPEAEMAQIVQQLQRVLPGGDIQVQVVPNNSANGKPFFNVTVNVRWSEANRLLDRTSSTASDTTFTLQTNV